MNGQEKDSEAWCGFEQDDEVTFKLEPVTRPVHVHQSLPLRWFVLGTGLATAEVYPHVSLVSHGECTMRTSINGLFHTSQLQNLPRAYVLSSRLFVFARCLVFLRLNRRGSGATGSRPGARRPAAAPHARPRLRLRAEGRAVSFTVRNGEGHHAHRRADAGDEGDLQREGGGRRKRREQRGLPHERQRRRELLRCSFRPRCRASWICVLLNGVHVNGSPFSSTSSPPSTCPCAS